MLNIVLGMGYAVSRVPCSVPVYMECAFLCGRHTVNMEASALIMYLQY